MSEAGTAHLTVTEYESHLSSTFALQAEGLERPIDLVLTEVESFGSVDRFSLLFDGPANVLLPQGLYALAHSVLGSLLIFLVPISGDSTGRRYQAVFS